MPKEYLAQCRKLTALLRVLREVFFIRFSYRLDLGCRIFRLMQRHQAKGNNQRVVRAEHLSGVPLPMLLN